MSAKKYLKDHRIKNMLILEKGHAITTGGLSGLMDDYAELKNADTRTEVEKGNLTAEAFGKAITEGMKPKEELDRERFRKAMVSMLGKASFTSHEVDMNIAKATELGIVLTFTNTPHPSKIWTLMEVKDKDSPLSFEMLDADELNGNYEETTSAISEETFHNKEMCDAIRGLSVESPVTVCQATKLLKGSNDIARDALVIKKLAFVGFETVRINQVIKALNS